MKVIFEAKVTTNIQHDPDPKTGLPHYSSNLSWKRNRWNSESIYVDHFIPLGTKVTITCDWEVAPSYYGIDHNILTKQGTSALNDLDTEEAKALETPQIVEGVWKDGNFYPADVSPVLHGEQKPPDDET
jgi:hypothetical protein